MTRRDRRRALVAGVPVLFLAGASAAQAQTSTPVHQPGPAWLSAALDVALAPRPVVDVWAIAARSEIFSDRDAVVSGAGQRPWEGTQTGESRPASGLVLELEGRYDRSTENVFASSDVDAAGNPERVEDQILVLLGAVAGF